MHGSLLLSVVTLAAADNARSIEPLFNKYGSDKGGEGWAHGYHRYYDDLMPARHAPVRMLEIGVDTGKSMQTWEEWFTNKASKFHGIAYGQDQGASNWDNLFKSSLSQRSAGARHQA